MAFDLVGKAVKHLRLPTVDYDNTPIKVIPAQAGDINSRFFIVQLYDDRGDIDLSQYDSVTLNAVTPDEVLRGYGGEVDKEQNCVVIKIAASMMYLSGRVACDIALKGHNEDGEGTMLTSQTFYLYVASSQIDDEAIEADNSYAPLLKLLEDVRILEEELSDAEAERTAKESLREKNENTRKSQESSRVKAESSRVVAEGARVEKEVERVNNELLRSTAESNRAKAENARVSAETKRAAAENSRVTAENNRATAESNRVKTEQSRVTAENKREQDFNTAKNSCIDVTNRAETILENFDTMPCAVEVKRGEVAERVLTLSFVVLEE